MTQDPGYATLMASFPRVPAAKSARAQGTSARRHIQPRLTSSSHPLRSTNRQTGLQEVGPRFRRPRRHRRHRHHHHHHRQLLGPITWPDHRDPGVPELATSPRPPPRAAVRICRLGRSRSRGGRRPDVRHEEHGWAPGDWLAVLSPWWPGPIAVTRIGVVELGGDHVLDVGLQRGVHRPGMKSAAWGRRAEPERYRVRYVTGSGSRCVGQSSTRRWMSRSVLGPRELDASPV